MQWKLLSMLLRSLFDNDSDSTLVERRLGPIFHSCGSIVK